MDDGPYPNLEKKETHQTKISVLIKLTNHHKTPLDPHESQGILDPGGYDDQTFLQLQRAAAIAVRHAEVAIVLKLWDVDVPGNPTDPPGARPNSTAKSVGKRGGKVA